MALSRTARSKQRYMTAAVGSPCHCQQARKHPRLNAEIHEVQTETVVRQALAVLYCGFLFRTPLRCQPSPFASWPGCSSRQSQPHFHPLVLYESSRTLFTWTPGCLDVSANFGEVPTRKRTQSKGSTSKHGEFTGTELAVCIYYYSSAKDASCELLVQSPNLTGCTSTRTHGPRCERFNSMLKAGTLYTAKQADAYMRKLFRTGVYTVPLNSSLCLRAPA